MRRALILVLCACGAARGDAGSRPVKLSAIAKEALCVTKGAAALGERVLAPTMRAFALGTSGDAAALTFTFRGASEEVRALASGQERRQLGVKLRAANSCNVVYVMWRLDPRAKVEVSVKRNPGMATHAECGANGYAKVKAASSAALPPLDIGGTHTLRAEIHGDELTAWIDDAVVWRGTLPASASEFSGPAGLRSDNVAFDLLSFSAPALAGTSHADRACKTDDGD